jgi:anthranilate phosphoribosyltransferase
MHTPNPLVLEAQSRVCTGPHQSRPLGRKPDDPQPEPVLDAIIQTLIGEHEVPVSTAQMGAFFVAMNLRRNFPPETNWSHAEIQAFAQYNAQLQKHLTPDLKFILGLELDCPPQTETETIVITALKIIFQNQHLSYQHTRKMCEAILTNQVRDALKGAALIGQRMNRETDDEVRGYLDSTFSPDNVHSVNVTNLTHFGQPYNGSTRYFKPTLFVAAIRAALGRPTVLHGVDTLPPKWGITEEQILTALGCRTNLSLQEAAENLENSDIGFAYISQREYAPQAYAIRDIRAHIGKRPPWSATEKAQQIFTCSGSNHIVIGYYHAGYERPLLDLVWQRNFQSALAIKGEEGTSHFSLRLGKPSDETRKAINYAQGFHRTNDLRQDFACDVDPATYNLEHDPNPRPEAVDPQTFAQLGLSALSGEKNHIYDRLILNTALTDHLLGFTDDPQQAISETRIAIDSGRALAHLQAYLTNNAK